MAAVTPALQRLALRARPRRPSSLPAMGLTTPCPAAAAAQARQRRLLSSSVSASAADATTDTATPSSPPPVPPIFDPKYAQYKARKVWPPDFTRLSPQEQLRFEKRFKRRMAIRAERPRWTKFIKLTQLFTVTFVTIYCVLFMKWDNGPQPFQGIRDWFWGTLATLRGGQQAAIRSAGSAVGSAEGKAGAGAESAVPQGAAAKQ